MLNSIEQVSRDFREEAPSRYLENGMIHLNVDIRR